MRTTRLPKNFVGNIPPGNLFHSFWFERQRGYKESVRVINKSRDEGMAHPRSTLEKSYHKQLQVDKWCLGLQQVQGLECCFGIDGPCTGTSRSCRASPLLQKQLIAAWEPLKAQILENRLSIVSIRGVEFNSNAETKPSFVSFWSNPVIFHWQTKGKVFNHSHQEQASQAR